MSGRGHGQSLRGRDGECAELREFVAAVRAGDARALVLRGEAGVGKTALLDFAAQLATGMRCIQLAGVESDMELAYAGLQQLCAPLLSGLDDLPQPQRDALSVAFGRAEGPAPDRFLVGLAVLSLLAAASGDQPLLCVVDDAQWLDQVSVQTLGFVARRLVAEPVGMLFAVRDTGVEVLPGVAERTVGPLSDNDARALFESVMLGGVDPQVRDRVVAETRGNPLALLDVPRNFTATELAGGFWNVGAQTVPARIEESYARRIASLPEPTRRLLLLAAAEPLGDSALFLRGAARMGIAVGALAPAEAAGVVEFGPRMRFHHPLMRSAAYRAAEPADRRAVHGVLAEVTDRTVDPDRAAWHAASAAAGPDDDVAAELEASAARAQSKGGLAAAAAFLERAALLTADPVVRGARALAAAQAKRDAAATDAAYELLTVAEVAPASELHHARVARLRAQMAFVRSRAGELGAPAVGDVTADLLAAARRLEGHDDFASREAYLEAIAATIYAGRLGAPDALARAAEAARSALERTPELPRAVDLLLKGVVDRITGGPGAGRESLRAALSAMCALARSDERQVMRWFVPAFPILQESTAHELWDETITQELSAAVVREARRTGALAGLPRALVYRAGFHVLCGEFGTATTLLHEAAAITAATGHERPVRYHSVVLAAWLGDAADTRARIEAARADGTARGEGRLLGLTAYATAVLSNGTGRYEQAFAAAGEGCEFEDFGFYSWCLHEYAEAAAHLGDQDAVTWAVGRLEERAGASDTDWGLGALASARAFLSGEPDAEARFTEAIERLGRTRAVVHLARTHLSYGEWLRRANRRVDARRHLGTAHDMFTQMGAQAFAERARRELVAAGNKVSKQPTGAGSALTAQEAQIASLAAEGLTNQEIGAQLFISAHTVEWHLRKVFTKLAITSRRQLRTATWVS
ncbi:transcriptional regulator, luxR family [Mycolicibacterium chubuense NBB4]|uniref:Transcriptional regulator, luxR family n=1 Tax=Mycolicibacterium chubuense (strain NBB4) TaxID=710421 RepID=I4BRF3_MYCCN|nr:LuxR family transcriptional regulator [Mycolicibacterium chubuense]AFM19860.1 transcriptional regulator, luxR family [Mycolicibacterium chubuense NBB4]